MGADRYKYNLRFIVNVVIIISKNYKKFFKKMRKKSISIEKLK